CHGAFPSAPGGPGKWKVHAKLSDMALQELVAEAWVAAVEPAPFRHGVIPGFLAGTAFAEALCNELLGLSFYSRRNDLLLLWLVVFFFLSYPCGTKLGSLE
uniref:Uncharacterized protein n=1 Tax=Melopsittacus undulatus TaxID=13146 RepID=A0A8V5GUX0_MELUD